MQEYSTPALVLAVEQRGEHDGRVVIFTRELGKVIARAKSLYKLQSKLAAHLQPLTLVQVRLVERSGIQIVDALTLSRLAPMTPQVLAAAGLIDQLTQTYQPDLELWSVIEGGSLLSRKLLKVLGFDPDHARCERCKAAAPAHFLLRETIYLCARCFVSTRSSAGQVAVTAAV